MSNLAPTRGRQQPGLPMPPQGDVIAQYRTYLEAQKAVDYLSDNHFPVQAVTIVGVGLQMVERVTGRLTYARVALAGLASGAWFGLFVGLLISLFGSAEGFSVFAAIFIGAAFGLLFGLISYALTGGRRDFTSTSQIVASEYRVLCLPEQAGQARQLLTRLAGEGGPQSSAPSAPSASSAPSAPSAPTAPVGPSYPPPYQGSAPSAPPAPTPSAPSASSDPYSPSAPTAVTPVTPPADPSTSEDPTGDPTAQAPATPASGPTYGEMIDRKRREEQEREAHRPSDNA